MCPSSLLMGFKSPSKADGIQDTFSGDSGTWTRPFVSAKVCLTFHEELTGRPTPRRGEDGKSSPSFPLSLMAMTGIWVCCLSPADPEPCALQLTPLHKHRPTAALGVLAERAGGGGHHHGSMALTWPFLSPRGPCVSSSSQRLTHHCHPGSSAGTRSFQRNVLRGIWHLPHVNQGNIWARKKQTGKSF